jgi:sulfoxide reductase heme-binding subunit YedZ
MLTAASNPVALWYMSRGFGLVAFVLLTLSLAMGVAQITRISLPGLPRFVIQGFHRNVSVLAVALLAVHVTSALLDPYVSIRVASVFIPFTGPYRPVWLGLGAVASDLLVALVVTSLVRERIGARAWKLIHWCAYACWPFAVVHALGTGTDARLGWVQVVYAGCTAMVLAAVAWRLTTRWSAAATGHRLGAAAGAVALVVVVSAWAAQGPLRPGWARKAGTPSYLLQGPAHTAPARSGR